MYAQGLGVGRDDIEAVKWWRAAAEQGDAFAQYNLGLAYANAQGVAKNVADAAKWYRLAADQGHGPAQVNLGLLYQNGYGLPQDHVRAYMWFNLAASKGYKLGVKNRDEIAKRMTAAQIAEAQKLTRNWKPVEQSTR
jgi:TPR repeat protein